MKLLICFTRSKICHQTLACLPVLCSQFVIGIGWGWISPTLTKLQSTDSPFQITPDQASWLASIGEIGRTFSPFISPLLIDNIGRNYTLTLTIILFLLVWSSVIFVNSFLLLCIIRVMFGVTSGINDVVATIYTTENCSSYVRGIIGGVVVIMFFAGMFVEFFVASYLTYENAAIVNTLISIIAVVTVYYGTETPYYLSMKGKHAEAKKNLMWLQYDVHQDRAAIELAKMRESVLQEKLKTKSIKLLFSSYDNVKCILIVLLLYFLESMSGAYGIMPYASMIFSPTEKLTSNEFTILYGVLQLMSICILPFIVERVDRRILLVSACVGMGVCNFCTSVLLYLHSRNYEIESYPWLIFASITSFGAINSIMYPVVYVIRGELLPLSVRAIGGSTAIIIQSITSFCVAKLFLPITEMYGMEANFFAYFISCVVMTLFIYCILPETRGKSLEEIQNSIKHVVNDAVASNGKPDGSLENGVIEMSTRL